MKLYSIRLSTSALTNYASVVPKPLNKVETRKILLEVEHELQSAEVQVIVDAKGYVLYSYNAFKFLYGPLSSLIRSEPCRAILCGSNDKRTSMELPYIQKGFQQFRDVFEAYCVSDAYKDDHNFQVDVAIATAAFTLSLTTKQYLKDTSSLLEDLIKKLSSTTKGCMILILDYGPTGSVRFLGLLRARGPIV
ncbi:hypothetical protein HanPSC8_Chr08g0341121 [Helianthus annuus]|nr:hypothetical protein HanPSC8_Chr08g0341121 [Helianthus annuus]